MYKKYILGVPIAKIAKQNNLAISIPTLSKLLKHLDACSKTKDRETAKIIHNSLFPTWLKDKPDRVVIVNDHTYKGVMPIGEWID